jgi:hypothetical protein
MHSAPVRTTGAGGAAFRRATQAGPHPRQQLAEGERLAAVVVGPGLQAGGDVGLGGVGGEQQDGEVTVGADPAAEVQPIQAGQAGVQEQQRRLRCVQERVGLGAGAAQAHAVAGRRQGPPEQHASRRVGVHHQDGGIFVRRRGGSRPPVDPRS